MLSGLIGLRRDQFGNIVTTQAQKVWPINQTGLVCAYSWAGKTRQFYGDGSYFDFIEQSRYVISQLAEYKKTFQLEEYVKEFTPALSFSLSYLGKYLPLDSSAENPTARVIFVGYGKNVPDWIQASFWCENGIAKCEVKPATGPNDNFKAFSGSQVVLEDWQKAVKRKTESLSLVEAVQLYIQMCIDNQTDPYCQDIGGHIHIAEITSDNIKWIIPPIVP